MNVDDETSAVGDWLRDARRDRYLSSVDGRRKNNRERVPGGSTACRHEQNRDGERAHDRRCYALSLRRSTSRFREQFGRAAPERFAQPLQSFERCIHLFGFEPLQVPRVQSDLQRRHELTPALRFSLSANSIGELVAQVEAATRWHVIDGRGERPEVRRLLRRRLIGR
jgi:hypothetical protein